MDFRKTSEMGGGSFPIQKISLRFFRVGKNDEFSEKGGVHSNPKNFVADFSAFRKKAQHSFPKIGKGGGGGSEEVF